MLVCVTGAACTHPIVVRRFVFAVWLEIPNAVESLTSFFSSTQREGVTLALVAALGLLGLPHDGNAQAGKKGSVASLEGSWSGGGSVSFASGAKEPVRCRVI
jgi:hypothetical protein